MIETPKRKRGGRPSRPHAPGERVPMSFRVTPEFHAKIVLRAAETGRSITQEVELLLEAGLRADGIEARLDEILALIKPVRRVA